MSNENNPHGLPPEFQQFPEGLEQERRGGEYDAHGRQDPYGRQHGQGEPYGEEGHGQPYGEHAGHGESYEQYEQGEPYGQGEPYAEGESYTQYGDAYTRHEPSRGSYSDAYGSYGDQGGGWQPTPQGGEYDSDATAFFQLPEELTSGSAPLEAPGHGYVPPMIRPLTPAAGTHPAAAGDWATTPWPESADVNADVSAPVNVNETGQWAFHESGDVHETHNVHDFHEAHGAHGAPEAHDAHGVQGAHDAQGVQNHDEQDAPHVQDGGGAHEGRAAGESAESRGPQETAPAAQDPLEVPHFSQVPQFSEARGTERAASSDADSGEFPLPQGPDAPWAGTTPSATLPGGAPAPWATLPGGAAAPWAEDQSQRAKEPDGAVQEPVTAAEPDAAAEPVEPVQPAGTSAETPDEAEAEVEAEVEVEVEVDARPEAEPPSGSEPPGPAPTDGPRSAAEARAEAGTESGTDAEAPAVPPDPGQAVPADPGPAVPPDPGQAVLAAGTAEEHPPTSYVLRVNGTDRPVSDAWIGESLLYVLRERLGLAGAKDGCSQGECGACNVQVDGRLVASCLVPAATAAGSEVRTVEGLATDGELSDVQRALAACGAVQCGFCIPGMAMTVHDLLEGNHAPTELETRQALCGNLCRCSGYRGVLSAVREVVAERAASAAAASEAAEAGDEARIPHQAAPGAGSVQIHPHDGGMA